MEMRRLGSPIALFLVGLLIAALVVYEYRLPREPGLPTLSEEAPAAQDRPIVSDVPTDPVPPQISANGSRKKEAGSADPSAGSDTAKSVALPEGVPMVDPAPLSAPTDTDVGGGPSGTQSADSELVQLQETHQASMPKRHRQPHRRLRRQAGCVPRRRARLPNPSPPNRRRRCRRRKPKPLRPQSRRRKITKTGPHPP